ncbi:hypothetical protein KCH_66370 [Kitasatospora cheerisanensis KCTC 2395]|uniref:Uncharacterized protein n=1 Tax=Kitasatospora cheerisanensis KCTC 2395 TaxID=1348663 RepID=A0A066YNQ2_9ACTN|nr:hypothetical protein KCH_66370 [Kitasatospora cheerisanensis KCTC 2395]
MLLRLQHLVRDSLAAVSGVPVRREGCSDPAFGVGAVGGDAAAVELVPVASQTGRIEASPEVRIRARVRWSEAAALSNSLPWEGRWSWRGGTCGRADRM